MPFSSHPVRAPAVQTSNRGEVGFDRLAEAFVRLCSTAKVLSPSPLSVLRSLGRSHYVQSTLTEWGIIMLYLFKRKIFA